MTIKSTKDNMSAAYETRGAQLVSLMFGDTEYLWQRDAAYWSGSAPILFPMVGSLRDKTASIGNGKKTVMERHGFTRASDFELVRQNADGAAFVLRDNAETRAQYPFAFELEVSYRLENGGLTTAFKVTNTGGEPMPFCIGGHPGFNCPLVSGEDYTDYYVEFEFDEVADCPAPNLENLLIDTHIRSRVLDGERRLNLKHSLFYKDAIIFDSLRSRKVKLQSAKSGRGIEMCFDGFDYFGLWAAKNDAPYVCLEPWTGLCTTSDEDDVFEHKRGVKILASGETADYSYFVRPY